MKYETVCFNQLMLKRINIILDKQVLQVLQLMDWILANERSGLFRTITD